MTPSRHRSFSVISVWHGLCQRMVRRSGLGLATAKDQLATQLPLTSRVGQAPACLPERRPVALRPITPLTSPRPCAAALAACHAFAIVICALATLAASTRADENHATPSATQRTYHLHLTRLENPPPLLADFPEFVEPVRESVRYEAPRLVDDPGANLDVRAWRFSYNARGIIEMPNRLDSHVCALIVVHPWGVDDGQGWRTPEPAGCADFCTLEKNHLAGRHTRQVIAPLVKRLRPHVPVVLYSLLGAPDPVRVQRYRTIQGKPSEEVRRAATQRMHEQLNSFDYRGEPLPTTLTLSADKPVIDYFRQFPGLDASDRYNHAGFWKLPVPVTADLEVHPDDVVLYDEQGYPALRDFLQRQGVRHVLLTGYATDMCFCRTTAGYENLSKDFNVFLVGDATLATFPANSSPRYATNAHISYAALNQLVTQTSWIRLDGESTAAANRPSQARNSP